MEFSLPTAQARAYSPSHIHVPLPQGHRFPMGKYAALAEVLRRDGWQVDPAPAASHAQLARVHSADYLRTWREGRLEPKAERKLGLPQSPELYQRSLHSVGGTLAALADAWQRGYGVNLAGGTHHAFASHGEGFCVFNDLAISAYEALQRPEVRRVLIVDVDVHQGNGTAKLLEHEPRVYTLSVHGARNYPFHKETSDCDIALDDGSDDACYLQRVRHTLPALLEHNQPQLVLYQAGVDVLAGDRFGRMALSLEGVLARDRLVYELCYERGIPLVYTMGGGYQQDIRVTIEAHRRSLQLLRSIFYR